jgi:hypothetical protein
VPTNVKVLFIGLAVLGVLVATLAVFDAFSSEKRQEEKVTLSHGIVYETSASVRQPSGGGRTELGHRVWRPAADHRRRIRGGASCSGILSER